MRKARMLTVVILTALVMVALPAVASGSKDAGTTAGQPVTVRYWTAFGGKGTSGVHDDPIMTELTRRTGVIIDWQFNNTQETYNAMLASGDLPDILVAQNENIKTLIQGNNVIDMEPLLAKYGVDLKKEEPNRVTFAKTFMSEGTNKLYFIPIQGYGEDWKPAKSAWTDIIALYIRWDYYKEVGYPMLQNDIIDVIPILKMIQDKHPTTADGKRIYGLSPWLGDWDLWNFTIYYQGQDGLNAESPKFLDIDIANNNAIKSHIGDATSSMWKGAKFYNKAWQAGVLDPDSLIQKYDQAVEKQNAGRVLLNPVAWSVAGSNGALAAAGHPEQGFMPMPYPKRITMASNFHKNPYADRWAQAITVKAKNPERAMVLLNFVNTLEGMRLLLNGVEGTHWSVVNGVPRLKPDVLNLLSGGGSTQELEASGFRSYTHLFGRGETSWDAKYNTPAWFKFNEDPAEQMKAATPFQKDYAAHYGVAYPNQVFEKSLPGNARIFDGSFLGMIDQAPTDIKQIDERLLNYLKVQMVQVVMAKTDAEFDAMQKRIIEECKAIGYEQSFAWHKQNYEQAKAKVAGFYSLIGKK